jgi:hypothetical protein
LSWRSLWCGNFLFRRRVKVLDKKMRLNLVLFSNRLDLPALTIAAIYLQHWQIDLFFKWLKNFFGNLLNAVKDLLPKKIREQTFLEEMEKVVS